MDTGAQTDGASPLLAERPDATVFFDGACPLCSAEIRFYRRQRGGERLSFIDVSKPGVALPAPNARERFHVRLADGRLVSGARAFVAIWETLPGWRAAAWAARLPGALAVLEAGYRVFLPVRPWLSRLAGKLGAGDCGC